MQRALRTRDSKRNGAGISHSQAVAICDAGAAAIDVGGLVVQAGLELRPTARKSV